MKKNPDILRVRGEGGREEGGHSLFVSNFVKRGFLRIKGKLILSDQSCSGGKGVGI